jgi:hypothetical protein
LTCCQESAEIDGKGDSIVADRFVACLPDGDKWRSNKTRASWLALFQVTIKGSFLQERPSVMTLAEADIARLRPRRANVHWPVALL